MPGYRAYARNCSGYCAVAFLSRGSRLGTDFVALHLAVCHEALDDVLGPGHNVTASSVFRNLASLVHQSQAPPHPQERVSVLRHVPNRRTLAKLCGGGSSWTGVDYATVRFVMPRIFNAWNIEYIRGESKQSPLNFPKCPELPEVFKEFRAAGGACMIFLAGGAQTKQGK